MFSVSVKARFHTCSLPVCKVLTASRFAICGLLLSKIPHIAHQKMPFCVVKDALLQNDNLAQPLQCAGNGSISGRKTRKRRLHCVMSHKMITFAAQFKIRAVVAWHFAVS